MAQTKVLADRIYSEEGLVADIVRIAAANILLALCAHIAIPLPWTPVPITGQTFGVLLEPLQAEKFSAYRLFQIRKENGRRLIRTHCGIQGSLCKKGLPTLYLSLTKIQGPSLLRDGSQ